MILFIWQHQPMLASKVFFMLKYFTLIHKNIQVLIIAFINIFFTKPNTIAELSTRFAISNEVIDKIYFQQRLE